MFLFAKKIGPKYWYTALKIQKKKKKTRSVKETNAIIANVCFYNLIRGNRNEDECVLTRPHSKIGNNEPRYENRLFAYAITAKLISAFVFATRMVQSLYYLNPKFQASRHLLSDLVGNPEDRFSHKEARMILIVEKSFNCPSMETFCQNFQTKHGLFYN